EGFRGRHGCDLEQLVYTIMLIALFANDNHKQLIEMDINPLMVTADSVVAADVMIREVRD
ncbi:MAG: acetate--CoA ligase family protein, partial [Gammaproteobacteria bacterium]